MPTLAELLGNSDPDGLRKLLEKSNQLPVSSGEPGPFGSFASPSESPNIPEDAIPSVLQLQPDLPSLFRNQPSQEQPDQGPQARVPASAGASKGKSSPAVQKLMEQSSQGSPQGQQPSGAAEALNKLLSGQKDQFEAAKKQRDQTDLISLMGRAGERIGSGLAGSKADYSFWDKLGAQAGQPIEDIEAANKLQQQSMTGFKDKQELDKAIKLHDPKSAESVSFRKALLSVSPDLAKVYGKDFENISASDKDLVFDPLKLKEQMEMRKLQVEANKIAAAKTGEYKQAMIDQRVENQTNTRFDKETKDIRNSLEAAKRIDGFLNAVDSGELIPSSNVAAQLTNDISMLLAGRATTALADREKVAVNTLQTTLAKVKQYATSHPQAALPPAFITQIKQENQILKDKYFNTFNRRTKELISGLNNPSAKEMMQNRYDTYKQDYGYVPSEKHGAQTPSAASPAPGADPMENKIQRFMKDNKIQNRDEALKILREHGKI